MPVHLARLPWLDGVCPLHSPIHCRDLPSSGCRATAFGPCVCGVFWYRSRFPWVARRLTGGYSQRVKSGPCQTGTLTHNMRHSPIVRDVTPSSPYCHICVHSLSPLPHSLAASCRPVDAFSPALGFGGGLAAPASLGITHKIGGLRPGWHQ